MGTKQVKFSNWSTALCGAGTWTLREVDHSYLIIFEMWCWRRMEKISWTDRVRNEVSRRRGISYIRIKRRKPNCVGHILRRNWLLKF